MAVSAPQHSSGSWSIPRLFVGSMFLTSMLMAWGCGLRRDARPDFDPAPAGDGAVLEMVSQEIEYPDVDSVCEIPARADLAPLDLEKEPEYWDLSLSQAIRLALEHTHVLRDLGGTILEYPTAATTVFDPAVVEADPRFGVEAALSAFDTSLAATAFFEKNDRALNNLFEGGGTRLFAQDLNTYGLELSKRSAIGSDLSLRSRSAYNFNNAPGNAQPNLPWDQQLEFELRQPLLQGAGAQVNQIAGPDGTPGFYNGVLLSRLDTDVSLADFERGVQNLVSDVETAYWELYFAYRDFDAKLEARGRAQRTWREINALYRTGQRGGEAEQEWQAREQFFRLDAEAQDALYGRVIEKTTSNSFRGHGGIHTSERRLRLAMGLPSSDGRLIRPQDEPSTADVKFGWDEIVAECLDRRVELRRQRWVIKRRELELLAAKNYTLPRLDAVAGYRLRGLGHDWLSNSRDGRARFDNAWMNLTSGDFQEWLLGLDLTVPLGGRRALAAVRHGELQLARERVILDEQQHQVLNDLGSALVEKQRARTLVRANMNRRVAAREQLAALEAVYEDADESQRIRLLDLLLDAQRRLVDAESQFHRSLAEYMVAIKNVHYEKGSLLDLNRIHLIEGEWPAKAYRDGANRLRNHHPTNGPRRLPLPLKARSPAVSRDPYPQDLEGGGALVVPEGAEFNHVEDSGAEQLPPPTSP